MADKASNDGVISIKPSQKQKKWRIERMQAEAKAELKIFKRDFFEYLPHEICNVLDSLIWRWRSYDWFEKAWNEYRQHVLDAADKGGKIKVPGFVFNKYIDEQVKKNFEQEEEFLLCHENLLLENYMAHSGIIGMRWGVRRYQKKDGTLTEEGKRRYLKGYNDAEIKVNSAKNDEEREAAQKKLDNIDDNQANYFDQKKWDEDTDKGNNAKIQLLKESKSMFDQAGELAGRQTKGSIRVNKKESSYKNIPDDEMRRRINRLTMERQYGDLTGDNKYVLSGKEKAKEILQTVGSVLGIAASALTVGLMFKQFSKPKPGQGGK